MQQFGVNALHPSAPEFLSAAALFSAPIDLEAAIGRLNSRWKVGAAPQWAEIPASEASGAEDGSAGETPGAANQPDTAAPAPTALMHFTIGTTQVMLSEVHEPLQPERGILPAHSYYVAITLFTPAPPDPELDPDLAATLASKDPSKYTPEEAAAAAARSTAAAVARRRCSVTAHILLTQLAEALLCDPAAVGLYRAELGVVQPPAMLAELAPLLEQGQVPLPLWVNIRVQPETKQPEPKQVQPEPPTASSDAPESAAPAPTATPSRDAATHTPLTLGRTLGMPLFGHLDIEIVHSEHSLEEVYAELANVVAYVVTSDAYLLPGQTLSFAADASAARAVTEALSELDGTPVIRIMY